MYRPIITDEDCRNLSEKTGLEISNRNYKGERWPVVKDNTGTLDTSFSFAPTDKRWSNIAKKFKGNVLILGLGFGKSVIQACEMSRVQSVTVVENQEGIIEMFWIASGREFTGKDKLSIECKNAFEYDNTDFDHVFIDIFHDVSNLSEYKRQTRQLRNMFPNSEIHQIDL